MQYYLEGNIEFSIDQTIFIEFFSVLFLTFREPNNHVSHKEFRDFVMLLGP